MFLFSIRTVCNIIADKVIFNNSDFTFYSANAFSWPIVFCNCCYNLSMSISKLGEIIEIVSFEVC